MNKFKYFFILLIALIGFVSCNKDDDNDVTPVPLRDYAVQYKADNDSIEKYLKSNYIKEVTADLDIVIENNIDILDLFGSYYSIRLNSFGGYKIVINTITVDLWVLEKL